MKNNIEIRPNGIKIEKKMGNRYPLYFVSGSKNGPWDYLHNARKDADNAVDISLAIDAIQCGATHYHTGWKQFLKVGDGTMEVYINGKWYEQNQRPSILGNGYCVTLAKMVV